MTDAPLSVEVVLRQRTTRTLVQSTTTHAAAMAKAITAATAVVLKPGDPTVDWQHLLAVGVRLVEHSIAVLAAADRANEEEHRDDPPAARKRDAAAAEARGGLTSLKNAVTTAWGADAAAELHLGGELPRSAEALVLLLPQVRGAVVKAAAKPAPATKTPGLTFTLAGWDAVLLGAENAVTAALDAVKTEAAEAQATQQAKDQAMDAHDATYRAVAMLYEGAAALAGMAGVAVTTSPTGPKSGGPAAPESPATPI